jgi:Holliday junction resolvase
VRRAAKVDAVQDQIVSALRAAGCAVLSLAPIGRGCPDILVSRGGDMWLMELKTGCKKPNAMQAKWHAEWKATVYVVSDPEWALQIVGATA